MGRHIRLQQHDQPAGRLGDAAQAARRPGRRRPGDDLARRIFNDRLDAAVTGMLLVLVAMILFESTMEWTRVLSGRKPARVKEAPFVTTRFAAEEQG